MEEDPKNNGTAAGKVGLPELKSQLRHQRNHTGRKGPGLSVK